MDERDIYQALQGVFDSVFRRHDIKLTANLTAADVPGWDSFHHISIILATEKHFGIEFHASDIDDLVNIGDLVRAVSRKTKVSST